MSSRSRLDSSEAVDAAEVVQGVPGDEDGATDPAPDPAGLVCPLPIDKYPTVTLAHGGGGKFSRMLTEQVFLAAFGADALGQLHDGAVLDVETGRLAFSTDTFVIDPLFFPGGNIGSLAVHGTVNDLAMCGARPTALSTGFILEEGFPMEELWTIATAMQAAAEESGVRIVTGDTKVVDRGKGDGVFINTTGVGLVSEGVDIAPHRAQPGDAVLVSGPIATHGVAIMSVREGLEFETTLETDSATLWPMVQSLLTTLGSDLHVLRDPTRGGVASAVNEIADTAGVGIVLDESALPIEDAVRGACEILGLDPLYVANEGKLVAFVPEDRAEQALRTLRSHPLGRHATRIGTVTGQHPGRVFQRSRIGGLRVVEMLSGEQLPRIC
jgi:hydrogenase expression/formation protein HypE